MNNRKTTTVTRPRPRNHPRSYPRMNPTPAALLIALSAMTLACQTPTDARTIEAGRSPSAVTLVDREQIELAGTNNVGELLQQTPGVTTDAYGNRYGTNNNINLRGLGNDRTLVLQNGQRVHGDLINASPYDPYDLERVEVLRGPQGTLYGRNANSGVINPNTRGENNFNESVAGTPVTRYDYSETRSDSRVEFDPKALGTTGVNTGLRYEPKEPGYTPDLTLGQTWNTGRLNPQLNDLPEGWTPDANTHDPGLGTTLNTNTHEPAHSPTETTTGGSPATTTDTHAGNTPVEDTPVENTHQPETEVAETGDSTGVFNQPQGNGYASYRDPCPKVNRHEINNRIANNARANAANTAQSLISHSQPYRFFDYNYYNTTADELNNRAIIGNQLANSLSVNACYNGPGYGFGPGGYPDPDQPYVGGPDTPKTYYKIGHDYELLPVDDEDGQDAGDTTTTGHQPATTDTTTSGTTTKTTPTPTYKPTVDPIDVNELSDTQLEIEIEYGPSITAGYLREAADLRSDAERYRNWAKERREQAARARASAEEARKKAKDPNRRASSREFWEQQAQRYDDHADILDENARILDESAANDDAAADSYEGDAAQSAQNLSNALGERANRLGQQASEAARAHAAKEAEAARVEAERQRRLQELIRQSKQNSQSNAGNPSGGAANFGGPRGSSGPDMREPQIGREPRNETLRKLLD